MTPNRMACNFYSDSHRAWGRATISFSHEVTVTICEESYTEQCHDIDGAFLAVARLVVHGRRSGHTGYSNTPYHSHNGSK